MQATSRSTLTLIMALMLSVWLPGPALAVMSPDALVNAVRSGDAAAVRTLLAQHADPNRRLADGSTPLAWAAESGNPEIVRLLLDRGASPNGSGASAAAPLFIACQQGVPAILGMLLSAGADVQAALPDGITPLFLCAGNAPPASVARLIAAGAVADQADRRGQTPLMWAAASGRVDNIRLLLDHGAMVNRVTTDQGFTPLFFALKSGVPEAAAAVLQAGANPDYISPDGTSVVQLAMYQKNYAFAAAMIERGVDLKAIDRNGDPLLHAAVLAAQPSLVKLLLTKGADVNALTGDSKIRMRFEGNFKSGDYVVPFKTPLLLAAENGSESIMRMLVDAGADPGFRATDGTNLVLAAAASGKTAALALALRLDPSPNATNSVGQTPLHVLLNNGLGAEGPSNETIGMVRLLAGAGARTDIKDRTGTTAADIAADPHLKFQAEFAAAFGTRTASAL